MAPGDEVVFETRDGLDGQLTGESRHVDRATLDSAGRSVDQGLVFVEGLKPGTRWRRAFLAYETPAFGVSGVIPGFGFLADVFTSCSRALGSSTARWPAPTSSPVALLPACMPAWSAWLRPPS